MPISTDRPILYSTMTWLAYNINERFYNKTHYMWCTPYFNTEPIDHLYTVSPTSSPFEIYSNLEKEVKGLDVHSEKIRLNRIGIRRGADIMLSRGAIDKGTRDEIKKMARAAQIGHFRPLLCVISSSEAKEYCTEVGVERRASILSHEYIAADLPRKAFDVLRISQ